MKPSSLFIFINNVYRDFFASGNLAKMMLVSCVKFSPSPIFAMSRTLNEDVLQVFFSAPEPKAQVHYCDHALSVVRRPSVRRPSVRPSLTFHIFDFSSETAERNSTKLYRKQDINLLYQVCVFRADPKNKMAALASDWLRHFRLLL